MRMQRCRVCGSQANNLHHPSCPIGKSEDMDFNMEQPEEMFIVNEEMLQWISHAIAIAGAQYTEYMSNKNEERMLTERVAQFQNDYIELSDFAEALLNVGFLLNADDVVYLFRHPQKYTQYYMLWLELSRPITSDDETFEIWKTEVWERKQVGKQTKNTGD